MVYFFQLISRRFRWLTGPVVGSQTIVELIALLEILTVARPMVYRK